MMMTFKHLLSSIISLWHLFHWWNISSALSMKAMPISIHSPSPPPPSQSTTGQHPNISLRRNCNWSCDTAKISGWLVLWCCRMCVRLQKSGSSRVVQLSCGATAISAKPTRMTFLGQLLKVLFTFYLFLEKLKPRQVLFSAKPEHWAVWSDVGHTL